MSITKPVMLDETGQAIVTCLDNLTTAIKGGTVHKVFGIKRLLSSRSPNWIRTDDSINLTATASVGSSAGHSDFDDMPIYKDIYRETLGTGDVMVHIPKFYIKRWRDNSYEYIQISDAHYDGFHLHPAFFKDGGECEAVYVGAYELGAGYVSKPGLAPLVNITRATARTNAKAKGDGWGIIDIATRLAIITLFGIEFATYDSQTALGNGVCSVSAAIKTGGADSVANLTGRAEGTNGATAVVYRGIENPFGNVWEWTDGVNFIDGSWYVCFNQSKYADDITDNYIKLSYGLSTSLSGAYISKEGYDEDNPAIFLPTEATGSSSSTDITDAVWSASGNRICAFGGYWHNGLLDGLLSVAVLDGSTGTNAIFGSRLIQKS